MNLANLHPEKKTMKRSHDLSSAVIYAVAALLFLSRGVAAQEPPPAPVKVSEAVLQNMTSVTRAPGTIVSRHDARIATEIAGRLTWVAEIGEKVERDDVIATIDDRGLKLELKNNEATIRRLEASLVYMNQQVTRHERLSEQNIGARDQLDEAVSQMLMTEQELVQSKVVREQTLYMLERSQVRAPMSGLIVERYRQAGEYSSVAGELVRLVDTDNIEVRAQAPVSIAPFLEAGMQVIVEDRNREMAGEIRSVIPVADERSRLMEVRISLEPQAWPIGAPVRVALPNSEPNSVVAVPRDALILRQDSTYLFKLTAAGTVEQVSVKTGSGNGRYIEVRGDVAKGDQVVVRGGERLQPGQTVSVASES